MHFIRQRRTNRFFDVIFGAIGLGDTVWLTNRKSVAVNFVDFSKFVSTELSNSPLIGAQYYTTVPRNRGVSFMPTIVAFLKNENGATAIEYGLIAAGISIAIIAAVNSLGSTLNTNFTSVSTQLK